jgi:hypothetical protein
MEQMSRVVRDIVSTRADSINYMKALSLLDVLQQRRGAAPFAFDAIRDEAVRGSRQIRFHCFHLVDCLFKNGNRELLIALQSSPSILVLGQDPVIADPYLHHELCNLVNEWGGIIDAARALTQTFAEWRTRLFSFRFRYVMTQDIADKFSADFSMVFELLSMFNQALVTAFVDEIGPEDEEVQEILPNINEAHQRLKELRLTMPDPYVRTVIDYLIDYCCLCKSSYADLSTKGELSIDALAEMAGRGIPQPGAPPAPPRPEPQPQPQPADAIDLLGIESQSPRPPPQQPQQQPARASAASADIIDLLDLMSSGPPQQQPGMSPAASTDLIDLMWSGPQQRQPSEMGPPQYASQQQAAAPAPPQYASQQQAAAPQGGSHRGRSQRRHRHSAPDKPAPEPARVSGFEFADDVPDDGVPDDVFAAFVDSISSRKK